MVEQRKRSAALREGLVCLFHCFLGHELQVGQSELCKFTLAQSTSDPQSRDEQQVEMKAFVSRPRAQQLRPGEAALERNIPGKIILPF